MTFAVENHSFSVDALPPACDERELHAAIDEAVGKVKALAPANGKKQFGATMGLVMKEVRGRIDGARVAQAVARDFNLFVNGKEKHGRSF